jgi:hypothetical protein
MDFISFPYSIGKNKYFLCPWSGDLLIEQSKKEDQSKKTSEKIDKLRSLCDNPYAINKIDYTCNYSFDRSINFKRNTNLLIYICRFNFFIARKYAEFKRPAFPDSVQAIEYFHSISHALEINKLCLPRSLFCAQTSQAFKENGAIFIGVFLPTRSMHAWIIENGMQPDRRDNIWHQYRPIAAIG